jgi:hypothetical protein
LSGIAVLCLETLIDLLVAEALAEEIPSMAQEDEKEVADVGGKDVVVRRLVFDWRLERPSLMGAHVKMTLAQKWAKLGVATLLCLSLVGRWGLKQSGGSPVCVELTASGRRERDGREGTWGRHLWRLPLRAWRGV